MGEIITLNENTKSVQHLCSRDKRLAKVIKMVGEIRYTPHEEDPYSFLVHEIIEQMLSIKAGQKIYSRLEDLCRGDVSPNAISNLTDDELRSTGTSNAKVQCIQELTEAVISDRLCFDDLSSSSDASVIKSLTQLRGIGNWTAKMYLIFVLNRPDVLPYEDSAFLQSYRWLYKTDDFNPRSIEKRCKKWKPYSAIAARFLYKALDKGFTKETFHLYK